MQLRCSFNILELIISLVVWPSSSLDFFFSFLRQDPSLGQEIRWLGGCELQESVCFCYPEHTTIPSLKKQINRTKHPGIRPTASLWEILPCMPGGQRHGSVTFPLNCGSDGAYQTWTVRTAYIRTSQRLLFIAIPLKKKGHLTRLSMSLEDPS